MIETNLEPRDVLEDAARRLLDAAMDYWTVYRRATGGAAVVWVKDSDGRMVILTRGEYQNTLLRNIDALHDDGGKVHHFGLERHE